MTEKAPEKITFDDFTFDPKHVWAFDFKKKMLAAPEQGFAIVIVVSQHVRVLKFPNEKTCNWAIDVIRNAIKQ
jgi:hypothetical protein